MLLAAGVYLPLTCAFPFTCLVDLCNAKPRHGWFVFNSTMKPSALAAVSVDFRYNRLLFQPIRRHVKDCWQTMILRMKFIAYTNPIRHLPCVCPDFLRFHQILWAGHLLIMHDILGHLGQEKKCRVWSQMMYPYVIAQCKIEETPLLTHWTFCSFALRLRPPF